MLAKCSILNPDGTELAWLELDSLSETRAGFIIYQCEDIRHGSSLFFYYSFKNHHEAWCKDCFGYQNLAEFIVSQSACSHCIASCQDSVLPWSRTGISKRNRTPYQTARILRRLWNLAFQFQNQQFPNQMPRSWMHTQGLCIIHKEHGPQAGASLVYSKGSSLGNCQDMYQ